MLWLWCRPKVVALIGPLAWEPPYAAGVATKRPKKKKKEEEYTRDMKKFSRLSGIPSARGERTILYWMIKEGFSEETTFEQIFERKKGSEP